MRARRALASACLALLLLPVGAGAHPHLFVKPAIGVVAAEGELLLQVRWEWDELWSSEILFDCDLDQDGVLDEAETQQVFKYYFSNIEEYAYFMKVRVDGEVAPVEVRGFQVEVLEERIVRYEFQVPLGCTAEQGVAGLQLDVLFNDDSIYTAFDDKVGVLAGQGDALADVAAAKYRFYGVEISFWYEP